MSATRGVLLTDDGGPRPMAARWFLTAALLGIVLSARPCAAQKRVLVVGGDHNYPPYGFLDENGQPTGYNVALTRAIAETMGMKVEIRLGPWGEIRTALEAGRIDAIHGMFFSEERDKVVDFSPAHTIAYHAVFARRGSPAVESAEGLRGKEIIVMRGAIMHDYVLEKGLCDAPALVETQAEALRLLASGKHDYALVAKLPGLYWAKNLKLSSIVLAGPPIRPSRLCYAVQEGNAELLGRFAEGLAIVKQTGRYHEIYDQWLGALEPRATSARVILKVVALVVIPLLLILAASIAWTWALRRQVARRTAHLSDEVAQRQRAEERTERLNRVLRAIRNVSQLITREKDCGRLLQGACESLIEARGYHSAWIALLDAAGGLLAAAEAGLGEAFQPMRERLERGELTECGRRAMAQPEVVVVADPPSACADCPLVEQHTGTASLIARLEHAEKVYGVMTVSVAPTAADDAEERTLFHQVAGDIAFALHDLDEEAARRRAEENLRASQATFRQFFENEPEYCYMVSPEGVVLDANDAALKALGYTKEEIAGKPLAAIYAPESLPKVEQLFAKWRETGHLANEEMVILARDGHRRTVLLSAGAVRGSDGRILHSVSLQRDITERKRADEALRSERDRLRALVDGLARAEIGVDVVSVDYEVLWQNRLLTDRFGDLTGKVCYREYMGLETPCDLCPMIGAIRDNAAQSVELRAADGRDYELLSAPLPNPDGSIDRVIEVVRDITERKRAEEALRTSEERFRELAELLPETIYEVDVDGRLTFVNRAAFEQFGYTQEDFDRGLNAFGMVVPEDRSRALANIARILAGEFLGPNEYTAARKDGTTFPAIFCSSPIVRHGEAVGLRGFIIDITERKRAEEALRDSEERHRTLLENSPMGIWQDNAAGETVYVSPAMCATLEVDSAEELTGLKWRSFFTPESLETIDRESQKRLEGRPSTYEVETVGKRGARRSLVVCGAPLRSPDGEFRGTIATFLDITERKRAEAKRAELEAHLRRSQRLELLGTVVASLAHDYRNMLQPILNYTEMARAEVSPGTGPWRDLRNVLDAVRRATDLANRVQAFGRQDEHERVPVRLHHVVREALKFARAAIPTTIEIRQRLERRCGIVLADPTQIHAAVMNLCTNAAHAMREGGGVLDVRLDAAQVDAGLAERLPNLHEGAYVRLTVSDTGRGMDPATLERIFEPYFTTKEREEGTGLGLFVVHGTVTGHGGGMLVESEPGEGTTFQVYLPVHAFEASEAPEDVEAEEPIARGTERLLVVDDDWAIVSVARDMLSRLGYDVVAHASGGAALEEFRARPHDFDVLITDYTMPQMSGYQLASEVIGIRPDMPVILMTGFGEAADEQAARRIGIRKVVMKPLAARDLSEAIRRSVHPGHRAEA